MSSDPADLLNSLSIKEEKTNVNKASESTELPKETTKKATEGTESTKEDGEKKETTESSGLITSTHEVKLKLADLQADPNLPLYSVKLFEELGLLPELLKGLYAMGFLKPSKIQENALPLLIRNPPTNFIGQSQSGTGKTAAFSLNMLSRVDPSINQVQAICLSPARELARQTMDVIEQMGQFLKVTRKLMVPDLYDKDLQVTANIIVGTPGVILNHISKRRLNLSHLKVLVLDEADNMLDASGLGEQSLRVKKQIPKSTQIVLFSATFDARVRRYAAKFAPNANSMELKQEELNVDAITQLYMDVDGEKHKEKVVNDIYGLITVGSLIIFVETKAKADVLYKSMKDQGHSVSVLHLNLDLTERDRLIDDFREKRLKVLITTNVLARGIDIPSVNLVINYDLPVTKDKKPDPATYLHRIGRTGRFGRKGVAVSFVHDKLSYKVLQGIIEYFGNITINPVSADDLDELEKIVKQNS